MYHVTTVPSPLGLLTLAADGEALAGLWLAGQKYHGGAIAGIMTERDDVPVFDTAKQWLARYFAGARPAISDLPLAPVGSFFRQAVWRLLCEIPYGEVVTYGDLARRMAADLGRAGMSSQAVGGAVGHNPISIMIPCHRVVGANGSLTGYAGGLDAKRTLLRHEGVDVDRFFVPARGTAL